MKSDNKIEELKGDIARYESTIERHPTDPNNYYLKAGALKELGQLTKENSYYDQALTCYNKAIELNPQSGLYLADRSLLHIDIGKPEEAVQDIRKISELTIEQLDPIFEIYIKNTMQGIQKLDSIQNTIEQLRVKGEINDQLANRLIGHAQVTANHTAQLGAHTIQLNEYKRILGVLGEHDKRIEFLESTLKEQKKLIEEQEKLLSIKGTELLEITQRLQEYQCKYQQNEEIVQSKLTELYEIKIDKSEVESHVFKIPEEISNNPKMYDYYSALYNKLDLAMKEAEVICGGKHVAVKPSSATTQTIAAALGLIPVAGPYLSSAVIGGTELYDLFQSKLQSNSASALAIKLVNLAPTSDSRQNILKEVAKRITTNQTQEIKDMENNQEVQYWQKQDLITKCKDWFTVNKDKNLYQKPQEILGCIDALKIILAITTDQIKTDSTETEIQTQLTAIPNKYKYFLKGKIKEAEEQVQESAKPSSTEDPATVSGTAAPVAQPEDSDDNGQQVKIDSAEVHNIQREELHKKILELGNEIEHDNSIEVRDKQEMHQQVRRIEQEVTQLKIQEVQHVVTSLINLTTKGQNIKTRLNDLEDEIRTIVIPQGIRQSKGPIWFDIKKSIESFIGRTKELEELHKLVQGSSSEGKITVISQITAISGLGGIGKSELSRKYAQEHRENYYNVAWINAEKHESLVDSFQRLAQNELRISTKDVDGREQDIKFITKRVYEIVSKNKSLFIFDNAEQYKTTEEAVGIDNFLPQQQLPTDANEPYIIITSRNQQWGEQIKVLPLGVFTKEEAKEFITKTLRINDDTPEADIVRLAEELQYFPLALQQAVAYIKQTDEEVKNVKQTYKISNYLQEYEQKTKELLDYQFPEYSSDAYTKTTFTTWNITFDKIQQKGHHKETLKILNIMAYLASENIPTKMFLELIDSELSYKDRNLATVIQTLKQYSMIRVEGDMSNIHRLIQQVIRLNLKKQGKEQEIIDKTFTILEKSFPYKSDKSEDCAKKQQLLPHLESLLSHIDNWLKENPIKSQEIETTYLKNLLTLMSDGYKNLGDPKREKELLEKALTIQEEHYGSNHFEVARTLVSLSNTYWYLGDPKKQKELLERALTIQEEYDPAHLEVARTLVSLGNAYGDLGDHQKKKELLEKALTIQEEYDPAHLEVAITLRNLGNAYGELGEPKKQQELQERALKIQEKHYGSNHFEVARTLVSLGIAYGELGEPKKQQELQERALKIQEKHYGPNHFQVAFTLGNLGNAYGDLGNPKEQQELQERALLIEEQYYGSKHFEVAITLRNLGNAYGELGDHQKKKELLERALTIQEEHYGSNHFEVASTLINLSSAYRILGDYQGQKDLLERALKIQEEHYGSSSIQVTLHRAAHKGQLEVIQWLEKEKGADVNVKDQTGKTPLDLAIEQNRKGIIAYLKDYDEFKNSTEENTLSILKNNDNNFDECHDGNDGSQVTLGVSSNLPGTGEQFANVPSESLIQSVAESDPTHSEQVGNVPSREEMTPLLVSTNIITDETPVTGETSSSCNCCTVL